MSFECKGEKMFLEFSEYPNGSPKIVVYSETEGPYASLGKPSFPKYDNGTLILDDANPYNKDLIEVMVEVGILHKTETVWLSGFLEYGAYKFKEQVEAV